MAKKGGSTPAIRAAAFEQVKKDLAGIWAGSKGETYEVLFGEATCWSSSWPCIRRNEFGNMTYTLKWDGDDSVIWGTDYCMLLSELSRTGGRQPKWHSAKGKRPFVWCKVGGGGAQQQTPEPPNVRIPSMRLPGVGRAYARSDEDATDGVPGSDAGTPSQGESPKDSCWDEVGWSDAAAGAFGEGGHYYTEAPREGGFAPAPRGAVPPPGHAADRDMLEEDPTGAGAAAAALLRRLQNANAVPLEFSEAVYAAAAVLEEDSDGSSTAYEASPGADVLASDDFLGNCFRPPPPNISPDDAEWKLGTGPIGAEDTDVEVVVEAMAPPALGFGSLIRALFYDEWHNGSVRQIEKGIVEVLWDAEYSISYVPIDHVELRHPVRGASQKVVELPETRRAPPGLLSPLKGGVGEVRPPPPGLLSPPKGVAGEVRLPPPGLLSPPKGAATDNLPPGLAFPGAALAGGFPLPQMPGDPGGDRADWLWGVRPLGCGF